MKRIYLIRHCQPAFPEGKKLCIGSTDLPLSEAGLFHAARLAETAPKTTALFSSPLTRCVQTAQAFSQPVQILDGLREMDAGAWDGLSFEEIRETYPQLYAARGSDPTLPLPGGEDRQEALVRFRQALETAVRKSEGDLTVMTHGGILAVFLEELTGTWYKPGYGETVTLCWEGGVYKKSTG